MRSATRFRALSQVSISQENLVATGGAGYFYCFAAANAEGLEPPPADRSALSGFSMLWDGSAWAHTATRMSAADASLEAFTLAGTRISGISMGRLAPGTHVLRWNGRDDSGRPLPRGFYLIRVTLRQGGRPSFP